MCVCVVIVESHTVAKDEIISEQGQMGSYRARFTKLIKLNRARCISAMYSTKTVKNWAHPKSVCVKEVRINIDMFHLFAYILFSDTVGSSNCVTMNGRMQNE